MRRLVLLLPLAIGCAHGPRPVVVAVPELQPPPPPAAVAPDDAFADRLRAVEPHALQARRPFGDLRDPFERGAYPIISEWSSDQRALYPSSDRATTLWLIDHPAIVSGLAHREATGEPDWTCTLLPTGMRAPVGAVIATGR